jgi:hypothetical protein
MLDIFWNKILKEKGVTPQAEIEKMKKEIEFLLKEIEDRQNLIEVFSSNVSALNQMHINRHEKRILEASKKLEITEKLNNCKKEFDK